MLKTLIDALEAHDVERLAKLLASGEDPNPPFVPGYSYTPLDAAVGELERIQEGEGRGPIDAVVLLLRYGADVNRYDEPPTTTPLLTAVKGNQIEAVRILLAAGADPNVRDEEGETPLRLFTKRGAFEMVRLLLQCGADMYRSGGADGMNSISLAARRLNIDMVRLFLAHGADPMVPDNDGQTVLDNMRAFPGISEPETPEKLARFHAIRRLLGGA
jgi:uncharacterized protein